jgi:6-phospho-beta-glucosidase
MHVTVVGAGPFVAGMLAALDVERAHGRPTSRLALRIVGRDTEVVRALAARGRALRLGAVEAVPEPDGLAGSDVVVVQLRPGGTAGRVADEQLARDLGVPGDESLGVGGLSTALRGAPVLRALAAQLREHCPHARVLVLTNPLSTAVGVLRREGLDAVGCCELPYATALEVSAVCDLGRRTPSWSYTGLSHRGFLHDIALPDERDALALLVARLRAGGRLTGGATADDVELLGAVPLKYHALLSPEWTAPDPSTLPPLRAGVVMSARDELRSELLADPTAAVLPALASRGTPWYELMVVPVLLALAGGAEVTRVLDVLDDDGIVREHAVRVDTAGVHRLPPDPDAQGLGPVAAARVASYEVGERAWDVLLADPSGATLADAVHHDPAIPARAHADVVEALEPAVRRLRDQPVASSWTVR